MGFFAAKLILPLALKLGLAITVFGGVAYAYHAVQNVGAIKAEHRMLQDIIEKKNAILDTQRELSARADKRRAEALDELAIVRAHAAESTREIETAYIDGCDLDTIIPDNFIDY